MKKYIFFTPCICKVGGAEEYINKKSARLEKAGYVPIIFHCVNGPILISHFNEVRNYRITELGLTPFYYTKKQRHRIIEQIIEYCDISKNDEIFIESTEISMSEWGEMVAEQIEAKHVCIILQENHDYPKYFQDYLFFKYNRTELYGITKKSIPMMLKDYDSAALEGRHIVAECNNVVDDVPCTLIDHIPKADYTIGSIGRLEKNFVIGGLKQVILLANKYNDCAFNLILIGNGSDERVNEIKKIFEQVTNVTLLITGYMYPIPKKLLEMIDCFFSSAGSVHVTSELGKPTISMAADGDPIGIMNYTTVNSLYKDEPYVKTELNKYLEMILMEHYCQVHIPIRKESPKEDFAQEFSRQMGFFAQNIEQVYYPIEDKYVLSPRGKIYRLCASILGSRLFVRLLSALEYYKMKFKQKNNR